MLRLLTALSIFYSNRLIKPIIFPVLLPSIPSLPYIPLIFENQTIPNEIELNDDIDLILRMNYILQ